MHSNQPPKYWLHFFRWYCHPDYAEDLEGDLLERYERNSESNGEKSAKWRFAKDVMRLFRPGIIRPLGITQMLTNNAMIKNYLTVGWRNLLRNKVYATINIIGLSIGLTASVLIGLWIHNEYNYNRSFQNFDRIGRLYHNINFGDDIITYEGMPYAMADELRKYPELEEVVMMLGPSELVVKSGKEKSTVHTLFVDNNFPSLLPLRMIEGSRNGLGEINNIILSESTARTLFNGQAIDKTLTLENGSQVKVVGIFEDFSHTSDFSQINGLMAIDHHFNAGADTRSLKDDWENLDYECLVLLNEQNSWAQADEKIRNLLFEKSPESIKPLHPEALLHPMSKWNLYREFEGGKYVEGKMRLVQMLGVVGVLVLVLACINFINLSTAQSTQRAK